MKRFQTICCILLLGFGTLQSALAGSIEFIKPDLQLGTVGADQSVTVTFQLTNGTDATIKIAGTDSGCRCTSSQKSPDEIPGHGVGQFEWLFNSSRSTGLVTQAVSVTIDNGQTITGQFTATVKAAPDIPAPEKGAGR